MGNLVNLVDVLYQARDTMKDDETINFLGFCLNNLDKTNSQCFQDLWVLYETRHWHNVYDPKYFVEFGADDGNLDSNTLTLQNMGWHGCLSEPNPIQHSQGSLFNDRKNRNVNIYNYAIWKETDTLSFLVSEASNLSTIKGFENEDYNSEKRNDLTEFKVQAITLRDLLLMDRAPHGNNSIDYVSVDTEGSEFDILKTFFEEESLASSYKHRVSLFSVEHNFTNYHKIRQLMEDWGYEERFHGFSKWDSLWRLKSST